MENTKTSIIQAYEADPFNQALDEILHPGGLKLTEKIARLAGMASGHRVLDIASGRGSSACFLADLFSCRIIGVDLSVDASVQARTKAEKMSLSDKTAFCSADAESLPFADAVFDAVVMECAFSLLHRKVQGVQEMVRVLKPGGRLSISDVVLTHPLGAEFKDQALFDCCFSGALTRQGYVDLFSKAGLIKEHFEDHSIELKKIAYQLITGYGSLTEFWRRFGREGASCCGSPKKGPDSKIQWKRMFQEGEPGYAVFSFRKPL